MQRFNECLKYDISIPCGEIGSTEDDPAPTLLLLFQFLVVILGGPIKRANNEAKRHFNSLW